MTGASDERSRAVRFLTIEQVAEELNVGTPVIRTLLKTGELRGIQIGGRGMWRIGRQDVEAYIEAAWSALVVQGVNMAACKPVGEKSHGIILAGAFAALAACTAGQ